MDLWQSWEVGPSPGKQQGAEAQPGTGPFPAWCAGRLCLSEATSEVNYAACVAGGRSAAVVAAVVAATVAPVPDPGHLLGPTPLLTFFPHQVG